MPLEPLREIIEGTTLGSSSTPSAGAMTAAAPAANGAATPAARVPFGKPMRKLFCFDDAHHPLNHGSYGAYPQAVREARLKHLEDHELRPDPYRRFVQPGVIKTARAAVAPLLGPDVHLDEVVFLLNATTGTNTVLYNLSAHWTADPDPAAAGVGDDAVLYFTTTYGACRRNLLSLQELGRLRPVEIHVSFPGDSDDDLVAKLRAAHAAAVQRGLRVRMAVIDTIVSGPGVLMPWERLTAACRELGILSCIDGAHGIGQIDLTHLGTVQPDFFVSNAHKWLFVPRGCAVFYVPFRNQHYITTSMPTSWEWQTPAARGDKTYFAKMFSDLGTADMSPYASVPAALQFRRDVCGGEAAIRAYCIQLAKDGGDRAAAILGTEAMDNPRSNMRQCNLVNVRLPLAVKPDAEIAADDTTTIPLSRMQSVCDWIQLCGVHEFDTYLQTSPYQNQFWVRLSAMVYLDIEDFEWGAKTLLTICERVKKGEWKS